jgi:hypothetical protein
MDLDFLLDGGNIQKYWNNQAKFFISKNLLSSALPGKTDLINYFNGNFFSDNWVEPSNVNINASRIDENGSYSQLLSIDINLARRFYSDGFTLCFGDLSFNSRSIAALKEKAVDIFGHSDLIAVTAYLSPPDTSGVLHYDRQHNFFIQREGKKRWFVSEKAAVKNPHENLVYAGLTQSFFENMNKRGYEISLPKDCGRNLYELNPGDVLYIPPGFYHSPETLSAPSLHYTLTIEPACFWKDFNNDMFSKLLASNGKFFADYRFLSEFEKNELIADCLNAAMTQKKPNT